MATRANVEREASAGGRQVPVLPQGEVLERIRHFILWLDRYGEVSYDFQSFYAGRVGRGAKALYYRKPALGTLAVSPIIFCEAFLPAMRRFFWMRQRFPIADAHYAMGFALLAQALGEDRYYRRATHFLQILERTRCSGYHHYCWGYPYDWETLQGTIRQGTPLITTVPYVYEAFKSVYEIDRDPKWRQVMRSVAEHALLDYKDFETSADASTCSYTPNPRDSVGVINANAYRAFLLMSAARDFSEDKYATVGERNLNFVIESQQPDGSWYYSNDEERTFTDHFHTCFVLKALAKIEVLTRNPRCSDAIERGVEYYVRYLFDERGLPKPFSRPPRLTVYRRELYDYAECVNLAILLQGRFPSLDRTLLTALHELLDAWQRRNGSFRTRKLFLGWDNTPMHRWGESQMFRSLCFLLRRCQENGAAGI